MKKLLCIIFMLFVSSYHVQANELTWHTFEDKDEMTGEIEKYAISPHVKSTRNMSFPYNDIESWIGIGSGKDNCWVYIGFNESPNLLKSETQDGYNLIKARIKWDNNAVENITLFQDWGSRFLHFWRYSGSYSDFKVIEKISEHKKLLLELNWYGQGNVYFEYSLNGSSKSISNIRCNINPLEYSVKILEWKLSGVVDNIVVDDISIDDIPLRIYRMEVEDTIYHNWTYSGLGEIKGEKLETVIVISVITDGTVLEIKEIKMKKRSGDSLFDEWALVAIKRCDPFPHFPEKYVNIYGQIEILFSMK
jgi:TonB family protein